MQCQRAGFTLIELLLAIAISGILMAIAVPAYESYETHAQRHYAEAALLQLSARFETYFTDNASYEGATLENLNADNLTKGLFYTLSVVSATEGHFQIQATPDDAQLSHDPQCGILTLSDTNDRQISGSGSADECWK